MQHFQYKESSVKVATGIRVQGTGGFLNESSDPKDISSLTCNRDSHDTSQAQHTSKVPFSFKIGETLYPAGSYSVERALHGPFVVLTDAGNKDLYHWLVAPGNPAPTDARVVLRFDELGGNHYLRSVQCGFSDHGPPRCTGSRPASRVYRFRSVALIPSQQSLRLPYSFIVPGRRSHRPPRARTRAKTLCILIFAHHKRTFVVGYAALNFP